MYKNNMKYMVFLSLLCVGASITASGQAWSIQTGRVTKSLDQAPWFFKRFNKESVFNIARALDTIKQQREQQRRKK